MPVVTAPLDLAEPLELVEVAEEEDEVELVVTLAQDRS